MGALKIIEREADEFDEEAVEVPETVFEDIEDEIVTEDIEDEIATEDIEDEIATEDIGVSGDESVDVPLTVGGIAAMDASQGHLEEILEQIIERKF